MEWRRGNTTLVLYWRMMGGRLLLTLCTAYYQAAATARRKLTAKNGVCYQMQIFEWCISKCVTFTMCFTHNDTTNHMRQIGYWQSHLNWIKFSLFLPSNTFLSITLQLVQNKYSWRGGSWDISYICFCGSGQLKQWQVCWMGNLAFWTIPLNNSAQLNVKCKVLKQQFQECIKIQGWLTLKQHKQD